MYLYVYIFSATKAPDSVLSDFGFSTAAGTPQLTNFARKVRTNEHGWTVILAHFRGMKGLIFPESTHLCSFLCMKFPDEFILHMNICEVRLAAVR